MFNWRSFVLRRVLARFRVRNDIVRHLTTFQRLGERLEATPPAGESIPVGMRTVLRALRTRGAAQIRPGWVWPFWLHRQLDPASPDFTPRGHLPFMANVTSRNWTMIGPARSEWEGIVDPSGMVTPWFDGWSVDWWVGTPSGWRYPSLEEGLPQRLLDDSPVVETRMPLEEGSVVCRAYSPMTEDLAVIEITNETPANVDVALAIRPYNPEGLAVVEKLFVDGQTVILDGRPALYLSHPTSRVAVGTFAAGDCARMVAEKEVGPPPRRVVKDPAGMLQAAFVYELEPGASVRGFAPLPHEHRHHGRKRLTTAPSLDAEVPDAGRVCADWATALDRGMKVSLPDDRLQSAVKANRAYMHLFLDRDEITPGPYNYHRFWFRDAAYQVACLDRWGFHSEAADVIRAFPPRQEPDGFFFSQWKEWDSNGAAIWTVAEHIRLTQDTSLLPLLAPAVEKAADWIDRKTKERRRDLPELKGLFPAGISAEHLGPFDYYYWDNLWGLRGLLDAQLLAEKAGKVEAAGKASEAAARLRSSLLRSIEIAAGRTGRTFIPAGPTRGVDNAMIGSLAACYPLRLIDAEDPLITGTLEAIGQFCIGDAFFQGISHTGLGTYLTLQLAFVELEREDPRALRRLWWMLGAATPTFTWPEAIHPRLEGGCMGDGHHGWAAADFLSVVRNVLVREDPKGGIALFTAFPEQWRGRNVSVSDAPTHSGRITFDLRWDGGVPVLSWEAEAAGVTVRVPGLAPAWASDAQSGSERLPV
ncbi:MAG TPA: hypothetical protein VHJ78_02955 [Actinomycetota bacterium]|nr:hypothetical protein [Actinomycetota bacterium]